MTTFVNPNFASQHPGVNRLERVYAFAQHITLRLQQESTYAAALLMFGALSLAASVYDIAEAAPEGQELGAWVVLWTATLAAIVAFGKHVKRRVASWLKAEREACMWENALTDHRVRADIRWAHSRRV